jgi:tRNA(fMet)-specific endonuclease VapC
VTAPTKVQYLLDTMIIEAFSKGDEKVVHCVNKVGVDAICTSVVTRAEILRPRFDFILKETDPDRIALACEWLSRYEQFLAQFTVFPFDAAAASRFRQLRSVKQLSKADVKDLKIASIALARGLILVTRNVEHFKKVPGLVIENWMS